MLNSSFVTPKGRDRIKDTERELRRTGLNGVDEAYGVTLKKKTQHPSWQDLNVFLNKPGITISSL